MLFQSNPNMRMQLQMAKTVNAPKASGVVPTSPDIVKPFPRNLPKLGLKSGNHNSLSSYPPGLLTKSSTNMKSLSNGCLTGFSINKDESLKLKELKELKDLNENTTEKKKIPASARRKREKVQVTKFIRQNENYSDDPERRVFDTCEPNIGVSALLED